MSKACPAFEAFPSRRPKPRKWLLIASGFGLLAANGPAEAKLMVARPEPAPVLIATDAPKKSKPIFLSKVGVDVRIVGHLAETRTTLTFKNPNNRNLEGDFYFRLPDGATVSGYALDVGGVLVDGVIVSKQKARQVFETEIRKGIDPGLVEWTKGNNFKTRIFPIPANGTRTIRLDYVSQVDAKGRFRVPLAYKKRVNDFSLRVEVIGAAAKPVVRSSPTLLSSHKGLGFVATGKRRKAFLGNDLVLDRVAPGAASALVEKGPDARHYFTVRHARRAPAGAPRMNPSSINVFWDASRSRRDANHKAELAVLRGFLARHPSAKVTVYAVRNRLVRLRTGRGPSAANSLASIDYDGASNLGAIASSLRRGSQTHLNIVVTDGMANFAGPAPMSAKAPTWVLSSTSSANRVWMRQLAASSGGAYLDLRRIKTGEAITSIGRVADTVSARVLSGRATMVPSRATQVEGGSVLLAGELMSATATIELRYRNGERKTFLLNRERASRGNVSRRFFAQQKLQELLVDERSNASRIKALGREYGLVTPGTSLIVLERLEQYVEHEIRPPASLAAMRAAYDAKAKDLVIARGKERRSKIERVVAMWKEHVKWWNTRFKYRPVMKVAKKSVSRARLRSQRQEAPAAVAESEDVAEPSTEEAKLDGKYKSSAKNASISLQAWDPKTPYLAALKRARGLYPAYVAQRKKHGAAPAFYVDVAEYYFRKKQRRMALQVLSNLAELGIEEPALLRVLAHKLSQVGELDASVYVFEEVLTMRPEEPQSYRDLALTLAKRAKRQRGNKRRADYRRAMKLLSDVVLGEWQRFDRIEIIALTELNNIWPKAKASGIRAFPLDARLRKHLDMDLRIVMTWDADLTDMDLHVFEPTGEEANYSHNLTGIGGKVSRDFTQGYGPEVYSLRRARKGKYTIKTKYFGSRAAKLSGGVTLQVDLFTNYGRKNQKRKSMTLRLTENKEMFTVGSIDI